MKVLALASIAILCSLFSFASSSGPREPRTKSSSICPTTESQAFQQKVERPHRTVLRPEPAEEHQGEVDEVIVTTPAGTEDVLEPLSSGEVEVKKPVERKKKGSKSKSPVEPFADLAAELEESSGKGEKIEKNKPTGGRLEKKKRSDRPREREDVRGQTPSEELATSKRGSATLINGAKTALKVAIYTGVILIVVGGLVYAIDPTGPLGSWIGETASSIMSAATPTGLKEWLGTLFCKAQECIPQPCIPQPCIAQPCIAQPCIAQPCIEQPCIAQPCIPQFGTGESIKVIHICNANQCMSFSGCFDMVRNVLTWAPSGSVCTLAQNCIQAMQQTVGETCAGLDL